MEAVYDIVTGVLRLAVLVSVGVFAGSILETTGWVRKVGVFVSPFTKWAKLPPTCASAFVTAFFSPRAANSMLAGAYSDNRLRREEMITGAIVNTFPNTLCHLRILAFAVIPLLGGVGLAYVGFQLGTALTITLISLIAARFISRGNTLNGSVSAVPESPSAGEESWKSAFTRAARRTRRILFRVMLITVPLYIAVAVLDHTGVLRQAATSMPEPLKSILPPASITVIAGHMSSVMNAAGIAVEFLHSQTLTPIEVLMTLVAGYVLSVPIRTLRHAMPAALGIFPVREGFIIVVISQCARVVIGLGVLTGIWAYTI